MDDSDNQGLAEADVDAIGHVVFYNEPSAPVTPETRGKSSPFTRNTVQFSEEDLQDLPTVSWAPLADEGMAFESSSVVADSVDSTQYERQHHHRSSSKHRHKHDMAAGSTDSPSESVTGRSHRFSSGFDSSSVASSSGLSATSSYPGPSVSEVSYRPKSFTVGQLQAHKHRLATCTPARSCSPPGTSHDPCCNHRTQRCNKCSRQQPQRLRPATSTPGVRVQSSSGSACSYTHKPLTMTYSGGAAAGDARLMSSGSGAMPQRGLLLAENVSVQDVGKGFESHWYSSNRVLQVYDGSKSADPQALLRQVPEQPGLHLWLVKPPCSRVWVPVRLDAADNLQQALSACLHADGSCGPPGSKQRVLLDLQCRGFAVQVRYRPLKPTCSSVQQDLLSKLQRYDFALNDANNNGCRPIELPDGRPVYSYPLVAGHMMKLFDSLFALPKLL